MLLVNRRFLPPKKYNQGDDKMKYNKESIQEHILIILLELLQIYRKLTKRAKKRENNMVKMMEICENGIRGIKTYDNLTNRMALPSHS